MAAIAATNGILWKRDGNTLRLQPCVLSWP